MNIKIISHILLLLLGTLSITAQTIGDSLEYSELGNRELTHDGKIAVIHKYYKSNAQRDSVFIFNNGKLLLSKQTNFLYKPFKENSLYSYNSDKKELEILDGSTLKTQIIFNVKNPKVIEKYGLIFFLEANTDTYRLIKVLSNKTQEIWNSPKSLVNFTSISDNKQLLLIQYSEPNKGIELISLSNFKRTLNKDITYPIKQAKWSKRHPIVFFLPTPISDNKYPDLIFYNYKTNSSKQQALNEDIHYNNIETMSDYSFKLTQFCSLGYKEYDVKEIELWSTNDRYLRNIITNSNNQNYTTNTHIIFDYINNDIHKPERLNNYESVPINENTLLVYDSNQYLDYTYQWSSRPRDISLYDIINDTLTIISKQQESPFSTTSLSPKGHYFVYIKKGVLYIYNTNNRIIENSFTIKDDSSNLRFFGNRLRTWSYDEKYFYFVSHSNLIQYDTGAKKFKTLINANDTDSRYQIINSSNKSLFETNSELHYQLITNSDNKLLVHKLNIEDNSQSLILIDNQKKGVILKETKDRISDIKYSDDYRTITYSLENFNKPKTVLIYHNGKTKLLLENTMPKRLYTWQKQKIVLYKDQYGNNLQGLLFYPKDFDSHKKFPMITHIYEIQNYLANKFSYPSYLNENGFNLALLQENNYFVFLPDIFDNKQGTGLSALNCVEEGIKEILKQEKAIDKDNVGLFGFSHGGYKTNFIVTQTNLFKAAVSGAGNVDIIRSYFSYNENFISPFFFQFENGQYKMPKTFSEDKKLYLKNSPILFADQIKTPLLTFTGKKDENIHWEQQKEFFIGMLRYNIPHVALFYKNEDHSLLKKENQIDITKRLIQWFDYFLKDIDTKETNWVKYNTTFDQERMTGN